MSKPAAGQPAPAPAPLEPPHLRVDGQVLARMRTLSAHAPQSLVIEGGATADREAAALAWASLLNCEGVGERPCGACESCRQITQGVFLDLKCFGREDKVLVEDVRASLPEWGQPPRGKGRRVSIFFSAHEFHPAVANLLLKTLEEPRPGNVFVLLAPQRERLLQTLVSRSFTLTLPWPEGKAAESDAAEWITALLNFWDSGQGWFERTGTKGAADRALALRILSGLQHELIQALACGGGPAGGSVAQRLARLGRPGLRRLDLVLAQAQEALTQPTAPVALVLDWLATAVIAKGPKAAPAPRHYAS
ncbi:MAG: DNA polymerase III subunit delta' [Humidesulfovibrio sp.]|nr:DNA polymerase III subunit delta' [Humidesulfovibrio sp.]